MSSSDWKLYERYGRIEVRPYLKGEDTRDISVSNSDRVRGLDGGWVARDPRNHSDQWFISDWYFKDHYRPADQL